MNALPDLTGLDVYPEGESQTLEFKQSLEKLCKDKVHPTICAFLNTKGGRLVFGIEDTQRLIVGLPADSKKIDSMLLHIDSIYQSKRIVDDDNNPPPLGHVTTYVVSLSGERKLLVVDVLPSKDKVYKIADGVAYFRLSASNYRMTTDSTPAQLASLTAENAKLQDQLTQVRGILSTTKVNLSTAEQNAKNWKSQRDFAYTQTKQLQEQFKALATAAKEMEANFTGAAKGVDGLVNALEKDILAKKEGAEAALAPRPWWDCLRCW